MYQYFINHLYAVFTFALGWFLSEHNSIMIVSEPINHIYVRLLPLVKIDLYCPQATIVLHFEKERKEKWVSPLKEKVF